MLLSLPRGHRQSEPKFPLIIPVIDMCTHIRMQKYVLLAGEALAGQRKQECRLDFRRLRWTVEADWGTRAWQLLWLCLPCLESSIQIVGAASLCLMREPMKYVRSQVEGSKFTGGVRKKFKFTHLKSREIYFKYTVFSGFPISNK